MLFSFFFANKLQNIQYLHLIFVCTQTDFDQSYEYLVIEVNDNYLGICEGGLQNNYSQIYSCFSAVDISRYTGEYPTEISIRATIQDTVDRAWLDSGPSPYLLDANVSLSCTDVTQDSQLSLLRSWERTEVGSEDSITIDCQEIECGGLFTWSITGECATPYVSFMYYSEHYDDSMIAMIIDDTIFGHCGPLENDNSDELQFVTVDDIQLRVCFEQLQISDITGYVYDPHADNTFEFEFGFAITAFDELDGILNGLVAKLHFKFGCDATSC